MHGVARPSFASEPCGENVYAPIFAASWPTGTLRESCALLFRVPILILDGLRALRSVLGISCGGCHHVRVARLYEEHMRLTTVRRMPAVHHGWDAAIGKDLHHVTCVENPFVLRCCAPYAGDVDFEAPVSATLHRAEAIICMLAANTMFWVNVVAQDAVAEEARLDPRCDGSKLLAEEGQDAVSEHAELGTEELEVLRHSKIDSGLHVKT